MKPNNQFTSADNRFFYPANHDVEYHESLDTAALPGAENIPGQDHYVVITDEAGKTYAAELTWSTFNLPVNATIEAVAGQKRRPDIRPTGKPFLSTEEFAYFNEDCGYTPEAEEGTSIIVQADMSHFHGDIADSRFNEQGIAILPHGTPLPSLTESGASDEQVRYRFLGFINPDDKLVTWQSDTSYTSILIDWCVVNQLKQNRLEEALLHDALPQGGHLVGILSGTEATKTYLEFFDNKHGTSYTPKEDPRYPYSESKFGQLSERDYKIYRNMADVAANFISNPR